MKGTVAYLSPEGLHRNPAFSQAVAVEGRVRTVYVGGQNAVTAAGAIAGAGDVEEQAAQAARNLVVALAAAGATIDHVVKWTVALVEGRLLGAALQGFRRVLGAPRHAPALSVFFVSALARPEFLIEVEAVAVVPLE